MAEMIDKAKGSLTLENVLMSACKAPLVKIDRANFLRKELMKDTPESVIQEAIRNNPAMAGISRKKINEISKHVINYESAKVTGISATASLASSGVAVMAAGAAATDIVSYFVFVLRIIQELAYLYGFKEFDLEDNSLEDQMDSETMNFIMVFLGVMFGVKGATSALSKVALSLSNHLAKNLASQALTKGAIYPIIKSVATKVGIRMTKQIFADTVASAVPLAGSLLSGGLTYAMFKPACNRLRNHLMTFDLSDPDFYARQREGHLYDQCGRRHPQ